MSEPKGGFLDEFLGSIFGQPVGRVVFQYMPPEFSESKSVEYANVNVLGRSEPVLGYSHSGPRVFNITLTLAAGETVDPVFDVIRPLWLLRSWAYPDYSDGSAPNVPPTLLFAVGAWIRSRVVVTRLDIRYQAPWARVHLGNLFKAYSAEVPIQTSFPPWPEVDFDAPNLPLGGQATMPEIGSPIVDAMIPYKVDVSLTLQEVSPTDAKFPPGTNDVRGGGDRYNVGGGPIGTQLLAKFVELIPNIFGIGP
jgi:hypothetical protein